MSHFAHNLLHFARILRKAGLPVGPDRLLAAFAALEVVGIERRDDVHAALSAVLLQSHAQQALFDAAFAVYWRDPKLAERLMHLMLPKVQGRGEKTQPKRSNRLAEALAARAPVPQAPAPKREEPMHEEQFQLPFAISHSERERLQTADFDTMTAREFAWAQRIAATLPPPVAPIRRRRRVAARSGRLDLRATLRQGSRHPDILQAQFTQAQETLPPVVALLDISGSMERYSRLMLCWLHGMMQRHRRVEVLTFGTRLSCVTRALRDRDPDQALEAASAQVADWKGGTRMAACLQEFNRRWARRVLSGRAAVLLITDGLDREEAGELGAAAGHLSRMAEQLVWLNPLLRFDGFEPRAAGVKALLPHVDCMLPMHNLSSLMDLERALREGARRTLRPHSLHLPQKPAPWNSKANNSSPLRNNAPGTP